MYQIGSIDEFIAVTGLGTDAANDNRIHLVILPFFGKCARCGLMQASEKRIGRCTDCKSFVRLSENIPPVS